MNWAGIIVLSGGCYLAKLAGVVAGDRFSAALGPVTTLLPPALFSGIGVLMTVGDGSELVVDARLGGVAGAVVAGAEAAAGADDDCANLTPSL